MKDFNHLLLLNMKTNLVKIDRVSGDFFKIKNNPDFHFMIGLNYGIYLKYITNSNDDFIDNLYQQKESFINILEKLFVNDDFIYLNEDEIQFVFEFVNLSCSIILESDGIDFSNRHIIKYFKIAQGLVKSILKVTEKVSHIK